MHGLSASLSYRPDIDGLRALAVLPVVLFHLGSGGLVDGGFAGVDVFFVISGYLITTIIQRDLIRGCFTLSGFYERRILRIFPALFTVLAVSLILAWFTLLPQDFEYFGRTLTATASFSSNILFWLNSGYFAPDSEFIVLLHTWSLAVEEQFYIFFPLILLALARKAPHTRILFLSILFLISLALALWVIEAARSFAFYSLPTRAWELIAGSLLALVTLPSLQARTMHILSLTGPVFIMLAVVGYNDGTQFPGAPALLPVVGALLVIYTGQHGLFAGQRMLSLKPAVFFGKISYSLYLWHWPVIVFFKYGTSWELTSLWQIVLLCLCIVLAYLSWRFIEQPARKQEMLRGSKLLFSALLCCVFFAVIGAIITSKKGVPERFLADLVKLSTPEPQPELQKISDLNTKGYKSVIGNLDAEASFVVWGDSHAHAPASGFNELAKERKTKGYIIGFQSCFPSVKPIPAMEDECNEINRTHLQFLDRHKEIKTVVLVARWDAYYERMNKTLEENEETHDRPFEYYAAATIDYFNSQGRKVVFITEVPPAPAQSIRLYLIRQKRYNRDFALHMPLARFTDAQKNIDEALRRVREKYSFTVIEPHKTMCEGGSCPLMGEGRSYYQDDDHISPYGSIRFKEMYNPIFQ